MGILREMFVASQYMKAETPEDFEELRQQQLAYMKYEEERDQAFFDFFKKIGRLFK